MADDSYMSQILGWLKGAPSTPGLGMETAPPMASYPSQYDADYARNYGFGDNQEHEQYLNNQKARVFGDSIIAGKPQQAMFLPDTADGLSLTRATSPNNSSVVNLNKNNGLQGQLTNTMMRAALGANRSPVAAVGFDPSRVVVDSLASNMNIGGGYSPKNDSIFTTLSPDDSVLHESTHRGLEKLRQQYPEQTGALMNNLPDEETVVRWLMHSKGGDPEGNAGPEDAKEREQGIHAFANKDTPEMNRVRGDTLRKLEELAIENMKGRGKRVGPQ